MPVHKLCLVATRRTTFPNNRLSVLGDDRLLAPAAVITQYQRSVVAALLAPADRPDLNTGEASQQWMSIIVFNHLRPPMTILHLLTPFLQLK